uniref:Uncharacterized protein n=1 Tax=Rhipicephalus zambeziensis TaxID=60191 RepID=A0A224YBC6_9ACAR
MSSSELSRETKTTSAPQGSASFASAYASARMGVKWRHGGHQWAEKYRATTLTSQSTSSAGCSLPSARISVLPANMSMATTVQNNCREIKFLRLLHSTGALDDVCCTHKAALFCYAVIKESMRSRDVCSWRRAPRV